MQLSNQPLAVELALGGMGLIACAWGHSILFPVERPVTPPVPPGWRAGGSAQPQHRIAVGAPRATVGPASRRPGTASGELPTLLRTPLEEAAQVEARRLGGALTAGGLFGPVSVRIEPGGTAIVSPVQEVAGVRLPAEIVLRFAAYVLQPDDLAGAGRLGAGAWPGKHLGKAIAEHLNAAMLAGADPPGPQAAMRPETASAAPQAARPA